MSKEYKVPSEKQPIFKIVKKILKCTIWRKLELISIPDKLPNRCIMVSNHCGKMGPMAYEIALPIYNVKWGAHEMLGNYKSRRNYLKNVFYIQKQGYSKFSANIIASFEAIFSKMIYKGMKLLGTYPDVRLKITIKNSMKILENNKAILIFPENSNEGYFDVMKSFFPGFVMLSKQYYKLYNEDLPIYPLYYSHNQKKMVIGNPIYMQPLVKIGMNNDEIADFYKDEVNKLYYEYFK